MCPNDLQIASQHREGYEYVWFTNPLPLASIPSVSHSPSGSSFECIFALCLIR